MTEIPTSEGKLYLSTAIDLFSRQLLGFATSSHPDAELTGETIKLWPSPPAAGRNASAG